MFEAEAFRRDPCQRSKLDAALVDLVDCSQSDTSTVDDIEGQLVDLIGQLGFDYFSVVVLGPMGPRVEGLFRSNYPSDWRTTYRNRGYADQDPVVRRARERILPFDWNVTQMQKELPESSHDMVRTASDYGINFGITFPVMTMESDIYALSFAGERPADYRSFLKQGRLHLLNSLSTYMVHYYMSHRDALIADTKPVLTAREREVLNWTLDGKTAWEVSKIIGRSPSTVDYHVQNCITKLGASNKVHAAALALRQGLI